MSICPCDPGLPTHLTSDHHAPAQPPVREGWVMVPVAEAVREMVERHRDEVALRLDFSDYSTPRDYLSDAFDCLLALVENREWPGGEG